MSLELSTRTLGDWLEHWAEVTPDKEYIVYSDRNLRFTWGKFNERVDNMAKGLLSIGVERGTHVGIWAGNVPDWLTFLYACAKIGAVAVTVNTNYKQAELEYLCQNSDMHTLCIVNGDRGSDDFVNMVYTMLPELKTCQRGYLKSERFPQMKNVIYIGQEKYRGMYNTAEILLLGSNIEDEELVEAKKKVTCHDVVNMQYTSGTTGFPKGVMLTHYNIANNGFLTGEHMKFTSEDKLCVCVPLFHCFGVVLATMNCLTHGCTQVMVEKFDPLVVLASIHKERCTSLYGVPTMFIAELNHPMFDMFDMSSLRVGIMAGALCPIELMRQVEEKMFMKVTSVYGLTEASPGMTQTRIEDSFEVRCTTVGSDYEFTEVKVIDPETGEECPVGVSGEILVQGDNLMVGYYKLAADSQARHDRRHHNLVLLEFANNNDIESVREYLTSLVDSDREVWGDVRYCENMTVNTVLTVYERRAKENGISVNISAKASRELSVLPQDLVIVVANLFENAINATAKIKNKNKCIDIYICFFLVYCYNSFFFCK